METKIMTIFTRTPLHVGAGSSVGAVDQPVIRERHTRFPIIPGSAIKGVLADAWKDELIERTRGEGDEQNVSLVRPDKDQDKEISWLFGNEDANNAATGALLLGEARLFAFPVRSARGGFAWLTCPLALQRAVRDGLLASDVLENLSELKDDQAWFTKEIFGIKNGEGASEGVFEDQPLKHTDEIPDVLKNALKKILSSADPIARTMPERIVIVSTGMLAYFVTTACEVAQHVKINDVTGTASAGALFNQENVPAETFFYAVLNAIDSRNRNKTAGDAMKALKAKLKKVSGIFQFGSDASTGLGYCTVTLNE